MIIELADTTASQISQALLRARRSAGSPAMGMVMTMVVVCDEKTFESALADSTKAGREHPSRILLVVRRPGRRAGLDAEVRVGDGAPGETVILWLHGPVADHADGVVLPLLLPDTPVVVWWPGRAPEVAAEDPVGELGNRRITDSGSAAQLINRARHTRPGDSDLAWTRLTAWRALLAAALDQYPAHILSATVAARRGSASALLLAAWLEDRLGVPVRLRTSGGPGITDVRMTTAAGDIAISRENGVLADYTVPGQPLRQVALKRRPITELLAEELRRMDPDQIYETAAAGVVARAARAEAAGPRRPAKAPASKPTARKAPAKKAAAKKAVAKKAPAKKTPAKKAPAKKTAAKRTTRKTTGSRRGS
ncbi:glucose-6-phosphate dehydrogenase assembly protein OpcA [Naumannella huperziae]